MFMNIEKTDRDKKKTMKHYLIQVRVTGIILRDDTILLVKQKLSNRDWSLPGGHLEQNESLKTGLEREIFEETGLQVEAGELLY